MGEMRRAIAREEQQRKQDRFASTLVIAASIIAAVRLARDDISRPSPRLHSVIADSVGLARMTLLEGKESPPLLRMRVEFWASGKPKWQSGLPQI